VVDSPVVVVAVVVVVVVVVADQSPRIDAAGSALQRLAAHVTRGSWKTREALKRAK
jgi:hypothetical protein